MDPQACVRNFSDAVRDGDYDTATYCSECYAQWRADGGFAAELDDMTVVSLDVEQDRIGLSHGGDVVEVWRAIA